MTEQPRYRQSLLRAFEQCRLSARFQYVDGRAPATPEQARGIIFHDVAAEILRTMYRTGELQISTQEAIEVLYEVMAQKDKPEDEVVVLTADERERLRRTVLSFASNYRWTTTPVGVEQRLETSLRGQNGTQRVLSGKLDVILPDPPGGAVVLDWKTSFAPPKASRGEHQREGKEYLSEIGHFQLDVYGLLVMHTYPSIDRVTLRESYVMVGEFREATLHRHELEHVERELGLQLELLERALLAGPESAIWKPTPGRHCFNCRGKYECPIPPSARDEGAITDQAMAQEYGERFVATDALRGELRDQVRTWCSESGESIEIRSEKATYELGWAVNGSGKRSFGLHPKGKTDAQVEGSS